jgi:hypothetical protein
MPHGRFAEYNGRSVQRLRFILQLLRGNPRTFDVANNFLRRRIFPREPVAT